MKNHVIIGPQFFQNEKRTYSNWRSALIRELIQNAVDAPNSEIIDFQIENGIITIDDNGSGMSRETLTSVFLVLGETTKKSADQCGGFGIARNLICFAQNSYKIISQDYICEGSGASYEISDSTNLHSGCRFIIDPGEPNTDWISIIEEVLNLCSIKQSVYINNKLFSNYIHRGRHSRNLSFGSVYVNKSGNPGVYVRSNGVWMFTAYSSCKAAVYVEVDPEISKTVFNSNRDSLRWDYQKELNKFLDELATETISAIKPKNRSYKKRVDNNFSFKAVSNKTFKDIVSEVFAENEGASKGITAQQIVDFCQNSNLSDYQPSNLPFCLRDDTIRGSIVVSEYEDAKLAAFTQKFDPVFFEGNENRYKLLKTWHFILKQIIPIYTEYTGYEFSWGIGWIFKYGTFAQHRMENDVHFLLLNPVNEEEVKIKYSINNREDVCRLITLACHEICHVGADCHNETFASHLTELVALVMPKMMDIIKYLKENV